MDFSILIFSILTFSLPNTINCQEEGALNLIRWTSVNPDVLFRMFMEPAGIQNGERLYACRAMMSNMRYGSGKLRVGVSTKCLVPYNGGISSFDEFEILEYPPDTVSWVPMPTNGSVPEGAIRSGMNDGGRIQHLCRAFHSVEHRLDVIPGKYASYHKKCYAAEGGREYSTNTGEVLAINDFGRISGVMAAPGVI